MSLRSLALFAVLWIAFVVGLIALPFSPFRIY